MAKTLKCTVCGGDFNKEDIIPYKRKNYCHYCLEDKIGIEELDKHYFYIHFQDLFNRRPTEAEWSQCRRLIKNEQTDGSWTWRKVEKVMTYAYEVERLEPTNEHGVIGILPYYEYKADKFYNEYYEICDMVDEMGEVKQEVVHIYTKPYKSKTKKVELKSIDALINWEDEE